MSNNTGRHGVIAGAGQKHWGGAKQCGGGVEVRHGFHFCKKQAAGRSCRHGAGSQRWVGWGLAMGNSTIVGACSLQWLSGRDSHTAAGRHGMAHCWVMGQDRQPSLIGKACLNCPPVPSSTPPAPFHACPNPPRPFKTVLPHVYVCKQKERERCHVERMFEWRLSCLFEVRQQEADEANVVSKDDAAAAAAKVG